MIKKLFIRYAAWKRKRGLLKIGHKYKKLMAHIDHMVAADIKKRAL